jgi:hypothetical protein
MRIPPGYTIILADDVDHDSNNKHEDALFSPVFY